MMRGRSRRASTTRPVATTFFARIASRMTANASSPIRRVQKGEIDLLERNKPIDLDGAVVFDGGRLRKRRTRSGRSVVVRGFSWIGRVVGRDLDFGGRNCRPLTRIELGSSLISPVSRAEIEGEKG